MEHAPRRLTAVRLRFCAALAALLTFSTAHAADHVVFVTRLRPLWPPRLLFRGNGQGLLRRRKHRRRDRKVPGLSGEHQASREQHRPTRFRRRLCSGARPRQRRHSDQARGHGLSQVASRDLCAQGLRHFQAAGFGGEDSRRYRVQLDPEAVRDLRQGGRLRPERDQVDRGEQRRAARHAVDQTRRWRRPIFGRGGASRRSSGPATVT